MMDRDFKGVWIPKEIWLDERLNALDKIILAEIDSLDKGQEGCWASNQYIAEFCQCSVTKVSTSISKLIEYGYLYTQSFDGRIRHLKSRLSNFERQTNEICKADFKSLKGTNTSTKSITNTKNIKFQPPTVEEVRAYCIERKNNVDAEYFVDYYTARKWKISGGRQTMVDWKACVRTWERNNYSKPRTGANGVKLAEEHDSTLDGIL